jgi:hypothetical protein
MTTKKTEQIRPLNDTFGRLWASDMSDVDILMGRRSEETRRHDYYTSLHANRSFWSRT